MQKQHYPVLDHKKAVMRAYKKTILRDGDGDAYVEKPEFPALLRYLLYFNKLFAVFDAIDKDDDMRLTPAEFEAGCKKLNIASSAAEGHFAKLDKDGSGLVAFDEFCAWVAQSACPVDGEVVRSFTTPSEPAKE